MALQSLKNFLLYFFALKFYYDVFFVSSKINILQLVYYTDPIISISFLVRFPGQIVLLTNSGSIY